MWYAKTDEEAVLVFDLLADRDASEPVLKYVQWLEDHAQTKAAEFLRLELQPDKNEDRLKILRQELDSRWLDKVTRRRFREGDIVRITAGPFETFEGNIVDVDARAARAGLILLIFYRPMEPTWISFRDLQMIERARTEQSQSS